VREKWRFPKALPGFLGDREKVDHNQLIDVLVDAMWASWPRHLGLVVHFSHSVDVDRMRRHWNHGERSP
jgi:hypothetical protein